VEQSGIPANVKGHRRMSHHVAEHDGWREYSWEPLKLAATA